MTRRIKKGEYANSRNPRWKGEKAGYASIHQWLKRNYGHISYKKQKGTKSKAKSLIAIKRTRKNGKFIRTTA